MSHTASFPVNEEIAFARRYLDSLAAHSVNYQDDFVTPPQKRPRRMPVVGIDLGDVPESSSSSKQAGSSSDTVNIAVKSLKPPLTFPIRASVTDSIAQLKALVSASTPSAPPVSAQRLLIKGKALADSKLLKEYGVEEGAVVHLILKAGWEKEAAASKAASESAAAPEPIPSEAPPSPGAVPALTISVPDDSPASPAHPSSRPITAAELATPLGPQGTITSAAYHATLSDPAFWGRVYALCKESFVSESDADGCWIGMLEGAMGGLSAGEVAKIKDVVGVTGMGGKTV